jgi:hypothetical protein
MGRLWREAVVTYLLYYTRVFSEGVRSATKTLNLSS